MPGGNTSNTSELHLAVLIDAENAPRSAIADIMDEVAVYGTPTVKRIYGDWTTPNMNTWKPLLLDSAITPIQQYRYTTGKNCTDSAMIIDAMDILYTGQVGGFVLVSSDSDFTRLAIRLREAGMKVYGMGEKKTPKPFIVACDKFVYIEVIRAAAEQEREASMRQQKKDSTKKDTSGSSSSFPADMKSLICESLEVLGDEAGYTLLSRLGDLILKKRPDFDPRNYGYNKLSKLVNSLDFLETQVREDTVVYVRLKPQKK